MKKKPPPTTSKQKRKNIINLKGKNIIDLTPDCNTTLRWHFTDTQRKAEIEKML